MLITPALTDATILRILGERIERYRIEAGLTQAELAEQAGIGKRTLERVESGLGAELVTLIRILRILNVLDGFERLIPELPASPIEQLKLRGKQRRRVSRPRGRRDAIEHPNEVREGAATKPWAWRVPPPDGRLPAKGSHATKRKK
ncbi:MAG TPA: helix-turn-helix transcriptional regulator [Steroidobacteraceae bacterium]|nr:helix-turn-helix transcriptional regulator [Steroidobacteraceae bacterium]